MFSSPRQRAHLSAAVLSKRKSHLRPMCTDILTEAVPKRVEVDFACGRFCLRVTKGHNNVISQSCEDLSDQYDPMYHFFSL